MGATTETGYGNLYAWGEFVPKEEYTANTYSYYYAVSSLPAFYDAANNNWGGGWHMPTLQDWEWLKSSTNTTSLWKTDYNGSGVNGLLFTSKHNGNTLFFPAAGDAYQVSSGGQNSYGSYWSSMATSSTTIEKAYYMSFGSGSNNANILEDYRWYGKSVRPVSGSAQ